MIDHIYLPVSDLKRSSEFYKKLLGPLGIDMPYEVGQPPIRGFAIINNPGFWLKNGEVAKDLYIAFTAKSADAVRASYKAAIDAGATSNRNRAFGPNGVPTTSQQTSATRTDTTSRLPISLGSTNKRYEPSTHLAAALRGPRSRLLTLTVESDFVASGYPVLQIRCLQCTRLGGLRASRRLSVRPSDWYRQTPLSSLYSWIVGYSEVVVV